MLSRTSQRYGRVAMILHWLIALLIALNFAAVWVLETMPRPERMQIMNNYKAIGLTVLILSLVRLAWRLTHRYPAPLPSLHGWEKALARLVHALFYVMMIGMPLTGWAMVSGGGPVSVFGLFSAPLLPVPTDRGSAGTFHAIHGNLGTALLVLFGLHVLGALKHQLLDRDGTLGRMVPFLRAPG